MLNATPKRLIYAAIVSALISIALYVVSELIQFTRPSTALDTGLLTIVYLVFGAIQLPAAIVAISCALAALTARVIRTVAVPRGRASGADDRFEADTGGDAALDDEGLDDEGVDDDAPTSAERFSPEWTRRWALVLLIVLVVLNVLDQVTPTYLALNKPTIDFGPIDQWSSLASTGLTFAAVGFLTAALAAGAVRAMRDALA